MGKLTNENISILKERIIDTLTVSDTHYINSELKKIEKSLIITGVGGSSVVCEFASKIFEEKNKCFTLVSDPRDLLYTNISNYQNILAISFSGNNFGVKLAFNNHLNKYLLTNGKIKNNNITNLKYESTILKEKSFISLASTLMPIAILLNYYLDNVNIIEIITSSFNLDDEILLPNSKAITIIYGKESSSAAKFLETTFIEAGIAKVIMCSKYCFCHGQSTLPFHHKDIDLIFFKTSDNDLDSIILKSANNLYNNISIIESDYQDNIQTDFKLLVKSIFFAYEVSKKYRKDLSVVKYSPVVKDLYYFEGSV